MRAAGTVLLAGASLATGLATSYVANGNHALAAWNHQLVRVNADRRFEVLGFELRVMAAERELERRVLGGLPLPYELHEQADPAAAELERYAP